MRAIFTRFIGATNSRPARIIAMSNEHRITIAADSDEPGDAQHERGHMKAAYALCNKMGWTGQLIEGGHSRGRVFVFAPGDWHACCRASNRIADLVSAVYCVPAQAKALRRMMPTATWAEIIASETGIEMPSDRETK